MKQKSRKKKHEWQPFRDVRIGDITNKGKVVGVEKEPRISSGTNVTLDLPEKDMLRQVCASTIEHNYTRMKRQIETLKTAAEMAPSRKSAERDLSKFLKITREEIRSITDFSSIIENLGKWEKSVIVEKSASRFGV
jgi:hypothetical protein